MKRAKVTHGYLVRETDRRRQIIEVLRRFDLVRGNRPRSADASSAMACSNRWRRRRWNTACRPAQGGTTTTSAGARTAAGSTGRALTTTGSPPWWRTSAAPARRRSRAARNEPGTDTTGPCRTRRGGPWVVGRSRCTPPRRAAVRAAILRARHRASTRTVPGSERMRDAAGPEQVQRWWRRWPDANVGVVTGAVSGLVVLDVDPRHGGGDSLAALEDVHGARATHRRVAHGGRRPAPLLSPSRDELSHAGRSLPDSTSRVTAGSWSARPVGTSPAASMPGSRGAHPAKFPWPTCPGGSRPWPRIRPPPAREPAQAHIRCQCARRASGPSSRRCGRGSASSFVRRPQLPVPVPSRPPPLAPHRRRGVPLLLLRVRAGRRERPPAPARGRATSDRHRAHDEAANPPAPQPTTTVTLPGTTEVRVVGDAAYQDVLLELTGGSAPLRRRADGDGCPPRPRAGQPRRPRRHRRDDRRTDRGVPLAARTRPASPRDRRRHRTLRRGELQCQ